MPDYSGTMKTPANLFAALRAAAPSIAIEILWEHDDDIHPDIRKDCDFEDADPNDWQAWRSEVCASAIVNGCMETGSAYLGGTWEKAGDNPAVSNPDISGYLPQMIEEALRKLRPRFQSNEGRNECDAAIYICRKELEERYAEQMKTA